jgi:hypothetical protein
MRHAGLLALLALSCTTTPPPPLMPVCLETRDVVTVVKESCQPVVTFTDAVDTSTAGVVICVLDPSVQALLCMTPQEAAARADL